jgi:hypothetical protein
VRPELLSALAEGQLNACAFDPKPTVSTKRWYGLDFHKQPIGATIKMKSVGGGLAYCVIPIAEGPLLSAATVGGKPDIRRQPLHKHMR